MKRREDNLVVMWHQTILEKRLKVACPDLQGKQVHSPSL